MMQSTIDLQSFYVLLRRESPDESWAAIRGSVYRTFDRAESALSAALASHYADDELSVGVVTDKGAYALGIIKHGDKKV